MRHEASHEPVNQGPCDS